MPRVHRVVSIAADDFNHGLTRNLGVEQAPGELVVLMVQDALPASDDWLAALVAPLAAGRRRSPARLRASCLAPDASAITRYYAERGAGRGSGRARVCRDRRRRRSRAASDAAAGRLHVRQRLLVHPPVGVGARIPFRADADRRGSRVGARRAAGRSPAGLRARRGRRPLARAIRRATSWRGRTSCITGSSSSSACERFRERVPGAGDRVVARLHLRSVRRGPRGGRARAMSRALGLAVAWPLGQYLGASVGARGWRAACGGERRLMRVLDDRRTDFRRPRRAAARSTPRRTRARCASARRRGARAHARSRIRTRPEYDVRARAARRPARRLGSTTRSATRATLRGVVPQRGDRRHRRPRHRRVPARRRARAPSDLPVDDDRPVARGARGFPSFYTLHDYWLMCHRGQLLDLELRVCDGPGRRRAAGAVSGRWQPCAGPGVCRGAARCARRARGCRRRSADLSDAPSQTRSPPAARATDGSRSAGAHARTCAACCAAGRRTSSRRRDTCATGSSASACPPSGSRSARYGFDHAAVRTRSTAQPAAIAAADRVSRQPDGVEGAARAARGVRAPAARGRVTVDSSARTPPITATTATAQQLEPLLRAARRARARPDRRTSAWPAALASIDVLVVPSIWPENSPLVIQRGVPRRRSGRRVAHRRHSGAGRGRPERAAVRAGRRRRSARALRASARRTGAARPRCARAFRRSARSRTMCATRATCTRRCCGSVSAGASRAPARAARRDRAELPDAGRHAAGRPIAARVAPAARRDHRRRQRR